jgi:transmembrane sensor
MNETPQGLEGATETPMEAAARWFALHRRAPDSIEERQFAEWLESSPANQQAYDNVARSWDIAGVAAADSSVMAMRTEALMARPRERRDFAPLWGALATAALVVVAFTGVWLTHPDFIAHPVESAMSRDHFVLRTGIGERATASLEDGSTVTLNTNSILEINYTRLRRDVRLIAGQALFKVAHDTARPFIVAAANRQVVAVGTEFEVRLDGEKLRVALLQGRVRVERIHTRGAASVDTRFMEPGEQLVASSSGVVVQRANVNELVSWKSGRIRFDNTRLADAVAEMNRYNHTPIAIVDPTIADTRISGSFRTGESWTFAEAIGEAFDLKAESTGDSIRLKRRGRKISQQPEGST